MQAAPIIKIRNFISNLHINCPQVWGHINAGAHANSGDDPVIYRFDPVNGNMLHENKERHLLEHHARPVEMHEEKHEEPEQELNDAAMAKG